jgi:hypothetical protein
MPDIIAIRPIARRNHLVFTLAGGLLIVGAIISLKMGAKLPASILVIIGLSLVLFGISKWLEPKQSLELSPQGLRWSLKHGDLFFTWDNIIDLVPLHVNKGQGNVELHYIGLKLWDLTPVVETVAPRLARSLFHEYRSLLHVALIEAQTRQDDTQWLQEDAEFWRNSRGEKITGLKGMFAARLAQLKRYLGSDIYIPLTSLDRNQHDFIAMFRQYRAEVIQTTYD